MKGLALNGSLLRHYMLLLAAIAAVATIVTAMQETWTQLERPPWQARAPHSALAFKNSAWIVGGAIAPSASNKDGVSNDVWQSNISGGSWKQVTGTAAWKARKWHTVTSDGTGLWLMGGYEGAGQWLNDVWYSPDGATWTQKPANGTIWQIRSGHCAAWFASKLWVYGGRLGSTYHNDIWSSTDGASWDQVTQSAPWPARADASLVEYKTALYMAGGVGPESATALNGFYSDMWTSTDGATWTMVTDKAQWSPRSMFGLVVYESNLWIVGGATHSEPAVSDAWRSIDAKNWQFVSTQVPFGHRTAMGAVVLDGNFLVLGGQVAIGSGSGSSLQYQDDIWQAQPALLCELDSLVCDDHGTCKNGACDCVYGWSQGACAVPVCSPAACIHGHCHVVTPPGQLTASLNAQEQLQLLRQQRHSSGQRNQAWHDAEQQLEQRLQQQHMLAEMAHARPGANEIIPNAICHCNNYWTGVNCTKAICTTGCDHGTCHLAPDQCDCDDGYYGSTCSEYNAMIFAGAWVAAHANYMFIAVGGACLFVVAVTSMHMNYYALRRAAVMKARSSNLSLTH